MIAITHPRFGVEEEAAIHKVLASAGNVDQGECVAAFEKQFAEMCQARTP